MYTVWLMNGQYLFTNLEMEGFYLTEQSSKL